MKRSKIFALMSAAVIAVSGSSAFASAAEEQVYYIPQFENENFDIIGKKFVEWQEMTDFLDLEDCFAAVSELDRLICVTPHEDGSCTFRRICILPTLFFVDEEDSIRLEEYLKAKHPKIRINKKKFNEDDEDYFFSVDSHVGYDEEEIDLAMAVKAELGIMCYFVMEDEEIPVKKGTIADIPVNEDIEKILSIPFEEFMGMTGEEICALSPKAEELFKEARLSVRADFVRDDPNIVFRSVEGLTSYDETGEFVPTEELVRQLAIPVEFIRFMNYNCACYASDYGRRYYDMMTYLDPAADSSHTDSWTRTRLLTRLYAAGEAEDNIFTVSNERAAGGGYSEQAAKDLLYGDANCDGKVSIADATAIMQYIGNKDVYALSAAGLANADCYDPGSGVTGMDALAVQQMDARALKALPVV